MKKNSNNAIKLLHIDNMQHLKKTNWEFFTSKIQSSMCSDVNCLYCLCSDVNRFHGGLPVSPAGHYIVGTDALGRSLSLQYIYLYSYLVTHLVHFSPFCSNRVVFPTLSVLLSSAAWVKVTCFGLIVTEVMLPNGIRSTMYKLNFHWYALISPKKPCATVQCIL